MDVNEEDVGFELAMALLDYNRKLGIPVSFDELGVDENKLLDRVEKFMEYIVNSAPMRANPRVMDPQDIRNVVKLAWSGELS